MQASGAVQYAHFISWSEYFSCYVSVSCKLVIFIVVCLFLCSFGISYVSYVCVLNVRRTTLHNHTLVIFVVVSTTVTAADFLEQKSSPKCRMNFELDVKLNSFTCCVLVYSYLSMWLRRVWGQKLHRPVHIKTSISSPPASPQNCLHPHAFEVVQWLSNGHQLVCNEDESV